MSSSLKNWEKPHLSFLLVTQLFSIYSSYIFHLQTNTPGSEMLEDIINIL